MNYLHNLINLYGGFDPSQHPLPRLQTNPVEQIPRTQSSEVQGPGGDTEIEFVGVGNEVLPPGHARMSFHFYDKINLMFQNAQLYNPHINYQNNLNNLYNHTYIINNTYNYTYINDQFGTIIRDIRISCNNLLTNVQIVISQGSREIIENIMRFITNLWDDNNTLIVSKINGRITFKNIHKFFQQFSIIYNIIIELVRQGFFNSEQYNDFIENILELEKIEIIQNNIDNSIREINILLDSFNFNDLLRYVLEQKIVDIKRQLTSIYYPQHWYHHLQHSGNGCYLKFTTDQYVNHNNSNVYAYLSIHQPSGPLSNTIHYKAYHNHSLQEIGIFESVFRMQDQRASSVINVIHRYYDHRFRYLTDEFRNLLQLLQKFGEIQTRYERHLRQIIINFGSNGINTPEYYTNKINIIKHVIEIFLSLDSVRDLFQLQLDHIEPIQLANKQSILDERSSIHLNEIEIAEVEARAEAEAVALREANQQNDSLIEQAEQQEDVEQEQALQQKYEEERRKEALRREQLKQHVADLQRKYAQQQIAKRQTTPVIEQVEEEPGEPVRKRAAQLVEVEDELDKLYTLFEKVAFDAENVYRLSQQQVQYRKEIDKNPESYEEGEGEEAINIVQHNLGRVRLELSEAQRIHQEYIYEKRRHLDNTLISSYIKRAEKAIMDTQKEINPYIQQQSGGNIDYYSKYLKYKKKYLELKKSIN